MTKRKEYFISEVKRDDCGLHITVPVPKSRVTNFVLFTWFTVWVAGGILAILGYVEIESGQLVLFTLAWSVFAVLGFLSIVWQLTGRQLIHLNDEQLMVTVEAKWWYTKRTYDLNRIHDLQIDPTQKMRRGSGFGFFPGGKLKFSYEGKTIRFLKEVGHEEATYILEELRNTNK